MEWLTNLELSTNGKIFIIFIAVICFCIRIFFCNLKYKKIKLKQFKIDKMIGDIERGMLHLKDEILKQEIIISIETISTRIKDCTSDHCSNKQNWVCFIINLFCPRQYNFVDNELEEHLKTLTKIKSLLPKPLL